MAPDDQKNYQDILIPKVWEKILVDELRFEHYLINKGVSDYIRTLEKELTNTRELLHKELERLKHAKKEVPGDTPGNFSHVEHL